MSPGQPGAPYAQGFASASGYAGQPATKKSPVGWIVGGVVALVVVVAITIFATGILRLPGTTASSEPPKDPKEAARAVVNDYLKAISEGRAKDAVKMLDTSSINDDSLLTDEVLKDSLERAPIDGIEVDEADGSGPSYQVKAKYSVAGDSSSEDFRVIVEDSEAKIGASLPTLSLYGVKDVGVKVNGVKAESESPSVFPGSYKVEADNKYLEIEGKSTLTVQSVTKRDTSMLSLRVSDEGIKMFREKVLPEAKKCLASKALKPGCNMQLEAKTSNGFEIRDGSITRTQDAAARTKMEKVIPKADSSVPTVISSREFGYFKINAECKKAGQPWQPCTLTGFGSGSTWGKASIDVTDPSLKVTWD